MAPLTAGAREVVRWVGVLSRHTKLDIVLRPNTLGEAGVGASLGYLRLRASAQHLLLWSHLS